LIVNPEFPKWAVYLALMNDSPPPDVYERIDFMDGYDPLHIDCKKMGF